MQELMRISLFRKRNRKRPTREQRILHQELIRKERRMHELNEQNELLLKTSIRQSRTITELKEKLRELQERLK